MATTYTSTINIDVWKEHTCVCCGNTFRYRFQRKKVGRGGSPQAATNAVHAAVGKALAHEVDDHPCPHCGLYQPDMVGTKKTMYHGLVTLAAFFALFVPLIVFAADGITSINAPWLIAGLCSLVVVVHWLIDFRNPNRDLDRNQRLAELRVNNGVLQVPAGAAPATERNEAARGAPWTGGHTAAYLIMFVGLIAFLSPELYRTTAGLKENPGWYPLFSGPGDQPYIYFPDSITSIKGLWSGTPKVRVRNAAAVGLGSEVLQGSTHTDSWGGGPKNEITVDDKGSKTSTNRLWLRAQLPSDPKLEGKELDLELNITVQFPQLQGIDKWIPATYSPARPMDKKLVLGPPNCGSRYQSYWWGGFLGGALLIVVPSFILCGLSSGMRKRALPTNILLPDENRPQPPPDTLV